MVNDVVIERIEPVGNFQRRVILRNKNGDTASILFGDSITEKSMVFRALMLAPTKFKRRNAK
ncbi:hypothetical protein J31TS3_47690 [Paenibacillus lactis]|nr:hypothetical protein J31TS3_47690 [Paenibacillus lactis]